MLKRVFKHRYQIPDQVVISEDATYRLQVGGERALAAMFPNPMWCTHGGGIGLPGWNCMTVEMWRSWRGNLMISLSDCLRVKRVSWKKSPWTLANNFQHVPLILIMSCTLTNLQIRILILCFWMFCTCDFETVTVSNTKLASWCIKNHLVNTVVQIHVSKHPQTN